MSSMWLPIVFLNGIFFVVGQSVVKFPVSSKSSPRSSVHYAIEEETSPGTPIGHGVGLDSGFVERLEAADDAAIIGNLRYRFLTQPPSFLELDERDGVLRTRGRLDREEICKSDTENDGVTQSNDNSCQVRIDIAVQPMQYFQIFKVFITILDINDNDPIFPINATRHIDIVESAPIGSRFPIPVAIDRDSNRFSIQRYAFAGVTSKPELVFELRNDRNPDGSIDLKLVLVRGLDRESRAEYYLTIVAFDGGVPTPRSATCDVTVAVLDVNDNRPVFERNHYEASVVENALSGTSILRVHATDQDIGINGVVRYHLASGSHGNLFAVNEFTGDVTVVGALDYERSSIHHILVSAVDGDSTVSPEVALSSDVPVQIRIVDVNDNAPMVTINTLTASGADVASVAEDAAVGTFVSHVIVSDPDSFSNGLTQCGVVHVDGEETAAPFSLEQMFETEYQLVTTAPLDRESVSWYSVTLLCQDTGTSPLSTTVRLEIDVTDVNDNRPVFHSSSSSTDHDVIDVTYVAELLENNFVGVFVSQLNASDLDSGPNGIINYVLTDDLRPDIDEPQEKQNVGRLRQTSRKDSATLKHQVSQRELEDGTLWEIRDECSDMFTVDSMSGLVTARTSLNFEHKAVYRCRILAVDGGTPPQTGEARLIVNVMDVNDERPRFSLDVYTFYVLENRPSGTLVGTVSASDADSPPFNQFTYSVMSAGSLSDAFHIDATSGKLLTTRLLDRERQDAYHFILIAKDDQSPDVLSSTAAVTVYVTDVNDNSPIFLSPAIATSGPSESVTSSRNISSALKGDFIVVSSHARLGSVVARINAVDADFGKNSQVSYSLQPSDVAGSFRFDIDSHTGAVLLTDRLTSVDINATYQLTVVATDAGSPPLSTAIQITLKIVDGALLSGAAAGNQLTSPLSRYEAGSHRIFIRYGVNGLIAVITLAIITVAVCVLILVVIVCVVRRRRRRFRHFASKSSAHSDILAAAAPYCPSPHGCSKAATSSDKYNCRVEAMRALSAVNHRDVGVSNCSKSLIRPLDASPRMSASGRVMLVSDGSSRTLNRLDCDVTSDCASVDHHFRTVDRRLTTFRQSPSLSHVSNNYWNNGYGLPVTSSPS